MNKLGGRGMRRGLALSHCIGLPPRPDEPAPQLPPPQPPHLVTLCHSRSKHRGSPGTASAPTTQLRFTPQANPRRRTGGTAAPGEQQRAERSLRHRGGGGGRPRSSPWGPFLRGLLSPCPSGAPGRRAGAAPAARPSPRPGQAAAPAAPRPLAPGRSQAAGPGGSLTAHKGHKFPTSAPRRSSATRN